MRCLVSALVLTACYAPQVASGVACSPAGNCPEGQICTLRDGERVCLPPSGVVSDAPTLDSHGDQDLDGIADGVDNCTTVPNADQHNEDGDTYGDACDPCPPFPHAIEVDSDGDGVGDGCDPRPSTSGDRIYLFESFKAGVPNGAGWDPFGAWTNVGDAIRVAVNAGHANIGYPMPTTGHEIVWTAMTFRAFGANGNRGGGPIDEKIAAGADALACEMVEKGTSQTKLGLIRATADGTGGTILIESDISLVVDQRYELKLARDGTTYKCSNGAVTVMTTSTISNTSPEVGMWVANSTAEFEYMFVITSP